MATRAMMIGRTKNLSALNPSVISPSAKFSRAQLGSSLQNGQNPTRCASVPGSSHGVGKGIKAEGVKAASGDIVSAQNRNKPARSRPDRTPQRRPFCFLLSPPRICHHLAPEVVTEKSKRNQTCHHCHHLQRQLLSFYIYMCVLTRIHASSYVQRILVVTGGDSGDNVVFKRLFLSPPSVQGGDRW